VKPERASRQHPREASPEHPPRTIELAYCYLNRRDRTTHQMRLHLQRRGCREEDIDAAIESLTEQGYLDDARYARLFTEDKRQFEQWGAERIRRTLLQRGIDRQLVAQTLAGDGTGSEVGHAVELLRRRFPAPPRERRERERALGVLLRKGFELEIALEALAAHAHCADSSPVLRCP
jgi:regulatory protein